MRKNVIITQALGPSFLKMLDIVTPYMEYYAEKIDADFMVIKEPKIAQMFRTQTWFESFQIYDLCSNYERILYTDVDVIFHPKAPNIFEVVDEDKVGVVADAIRTDGISIDGLKMHLNEAFGKVEWNTPYFLSGMMVVPRKYLSIYNYRRYPGIANYTEISKYDFGQGLLNHRVRRNKVPLQYLDDTWNGIENKIYKVGINKDKAYIMHFTCLQDKRIPWLEKYAKKLRRKLPVRFRRYK